MLMGNSAASIHCSNPRCQASNSQNSRFCRQCRTPIVHSYLWVIGEGIDIYKEGDLIGNRYLLKQKRIVLDTKPVEIPELPEEIPAFIVNYLKLSFQNPYIPKVHGKLPSSQKELHQETYLLEYGCLPLDDLANLQYENILPELIQVWEKATPMRQLNWLWQIARLWQPLLRQRVASSLLNSSLLRTNERLIQLLELQTDGCNSPTLKELGLRWEDYLSGCSPSISRFLEQVCLRLGNGEIDQPEQLLAVLDQGLLHCGEGQRRTYNIYTASESGPVRDHNEDYCYPPTGKLINHKSEENPLVMVCDGVGGQDGGEIAAQLAVESMQEKVINIDFQSSEWNPFNHLFRLKQATSEVNDLISDRNDIENRQDRHRMGTTLVMTFASEHEMYLTHVGDSRIYLITKDYCQQLTVDDDLASREVRLGNALYRDALQYPHAGALIQALGMNPSHNLHPNIQRVVIDADCLFLLCSDGLSDNDRVEQYWRSEILPILEQKVDLVKTGERLIQIANEKNGHDNVTIALVYCQVEDLDQDENVPWSEIKAAVPGLAQQNPVMINRSDTIKVTSLSNSLAPKTSPLAWGLFATVAGLGVMVAYFLFPEEIRASFDKLIGQSPTSITTRPVTTPSLQSPITAPLDLIPGKLIKVKEKLSLQLLSEVTFPATGRIVLPGSIIKILEKKSDLVRLQICSMPEVINFSSNQQEKLANPQDQGWTKRETIKGKELEKVEPENECQ